MRRLTSTLLVIAALSLTACGVAEDGAPCDAPGCQACDTPHCSGSDVVACPLQDTRCPTGDTTPCPLQDSTPCPLQDSTPCPLQDSTCSPQDSVPCPSPDAAPCPGCDAGLCPGIDAAECPGCPGVDTTVCPGVDTVDCPGCPGADTVECPLCPGCDTTVCPEPDVGAPEDCPDDDPCTAETWTPEAGCVVIPLEGFPCDDGDICTIGETCQGGVCDGGATLTCQDENPCTDDTCDPGAGCAFTSNAAPCDDGDPCTTGDACAGGWCAGSPAATCGDGHLCLDEECEDGNALPLDGCDGCVITEFLVPASATGDQAHPAIAALDEGGWVAVWEGEGTGDAPDILARRFLPDGSAAGPDLMVNSTLASAQTHADVTGLAGGGFVVIWQSHEQDGDAGGIVARVFEPEAFGPTGPEILVNEITDSTQYDPAVAPLGGGGFVAAWSTNTPVGLGFNVAMRRFGPTGAPLGDEHAVNQFADSVQGNVRVAVDGDDRILVVWNSLNQDGSGNGIIGRVYAGDTAQGDEGVLNAVTLGTQSNPAAAGLADGGFVVVWQSDGEDGDGFGVHGRIVDGDGAPAGAPFPVTLFTSNSQRFPAVAADPGGGFHVAWQSAWQDGDDSGVFARRFGPEGPPTGDAEELALNDHTAGAQDYVDVAVLADGVRVYAWRSADHDGDGDGVFARRLAANGEKVVH